MIMALLVLKTRCKEFYEKNYRIVRSVLKIVISMIPVSYTHLDVYKRQMPCSMQRG